MVFDRSTPAGISDRVADGFDEPARAGSLVLGVSGRLKVRMAARSPAADARRTSVSSARPVFAREVTADELDVAAIAARMF